MPAVTKSTVRTMSPSMFAALHGLQPGWVRQLLSVRRIEGARKRYGQWRIPIAAAILPPGSPGTKHFKRPSRQEIAARSQRLATSEPPAPPIAG